MYKGYKLSKSAIERVLVNSMEYRKYYSEKSESIKKEVKESFDKFLLPGNKIDVEALQGDWFPVKEYDIFISHSHSDISDIETLAGYLTKELGLKVFVDSFIWKYCNDLLKNLDNKYNLNDNGTYSYKGSNWCCTNVTLILNSALHEVINKSEVLFFYNSPNSITHEYKGSERSDSPWIFSEILISKLIEKNIPKRLQTICEGLEDSKVLNKANGAIFSYPAPTNHLEILSKNQFDFWATRNNNYLIERNFEHPLDNLYVACQKAR